MLARRERSRDRQRSADPHDERTAAEHAFECVPGDGEHLGVARENGRRREIQVGDLQARARRQRVAQELLRRRREHRWILARRDPDRDPGRRARDERRVPEARLASEDSRDVERRLDEDALVELLGRALVERGRTDSRELLRSRWQLSPARDLVLARLRDACAQRLGQAAGARKERGQRLGERVDGVERGAAVVTGVQVALARAAPRRRTRRAHAMRRRTRACSGSSSSRRGRHTHRRARCPARGSG